MKSQKKSKSFTLIEVLISLIVIGIVATSFPIILQTTVSSSKNSAREETFYQEFSLLSLINSLYFDENNTVGDNYYKELNSSGDSELFINKYSNSEYNRIGKHQINNNDLRSGSNATVSHIGVDSGEIEGNDSTYDDIDDYNGFNETVTSFGRLTLKVSVKYIDDNADYNKSDFNFTFDYSKLTHTSNIKLITVSVKEGDNEINLSYPSMNIGASKFLSLDEVTK